MVAPNDNEGRQEMGGLITAYNNKLEQALSQFEKDKSEASVFLFDAHKLFDQILDDPCSHEETCPIEDTTSFCPAYADERGDQYRDDPQCPYSVDKYFWINSIHCM